MSRKAVTIGRGAIAASRISSPSTIQHIGTTTAANTSVAPVAHLIGDLMLGFWYKSSAVTLPTLPSGWTQIGTTPTNGSSPVMLLAYKVAASTSDGNDVSTGANGTIIAVYRNVTGIGGVGLNGADVNTVLTLPGFTSIAQVKTDSTSWIARCFADSATATVSSNPAGYTARTTMTSVRMGLFDSNTGVGSESSVAGAFSGSTTYKSMTVELLN